MHTHTHMLAPSLLPHVQRQDVDNQLICYGAVTLVYEHMHDDELHHGRQPCSAGLQSRTQRGEWAYKL